VRNRHSWVPYVAAIGGTVFFVKGVLAGWRAEALSDGVMALLYFGGIALSLAALVGVGLRQPTLLRRVGLAVGLPLLFLVWVMGLGAVLEPLVRVFTDSETAQLEARIVVAGLAVLAVAWLTWDRDQEHEHVGV
jgi:hypothetical protein